MHRFNFDRTQLLKYLPKGTCAEIGVARAFYSKEIIEYNQPQKLFLIDYWKNFDLGYRDSNMVTDEEHEQRYQSIIEHFSNNQIVSIVRDLSTSATSKFDNNFFDWIYIDADHSYDGCLKDLKAYNNKVKLDGYICGHDYFPPGVGKKGFGVNEAVNDFIKEEDYYFVGHTNEEKFTSYVIAKTKEAKDKFLRVTI